MAQGKSLERTERVTIRMTPEEHATLKHYAAAAGLSMTAFLIGEALGDKVGQMVLDGFGESDSRVSRGRKRSRKK